MPHDPETPMLVQYRQIKNRYQDCILFFRLGDFYEMFYEDAAVASRILDLVLTSRGKGTANHVPMCGIPYHSADSYITKLIRAGKKIAICEQVEDPKNAKGIVRRDVIRVITAGTFLDTSSSEARYIICLCPLGDAIGLALIDPSTGTLQTNEYRSLEQCLEIMSRLSVQECVYPARDHERIARLARHPLIQAKHIAFNPHDDWCFNLELAQKALSEHFRLPNLRGFGVQDLPAATASAGALLEYLKQMNRQPLRHIDKICLFADGDFAYISPAAIYGLELTTVFKTIDRTLCASGRRLLNFWFFHPLKNPEDILARQSAVRCLLNAPAVQDALAPLLGAMPDVEKSISRLSCGYTNARDVFNIRTALNLLPDFSAAIGPLLGHTPLISVSDLPDLRTLLDRAMNPEMPLTKHEGKVIRPGYHAELDSLKELQAHGHEWLKNFQTREAARTGIGSLKVGFNRIFGYYIEVTRTHLARVPADYIRKQTLVNAERFITAELKDYEDRILTAQEKILTLEQTLLEELQQTILSQTAALHECFHQVSMIDALYALSRLAEEPGYTAPEITDDDRIEITAGRHPVVERTSTLPFVPNDTRLNQGDQHLVILTGPNMAGKSTYIRQIAILVILAQIGSFIPADAAHIGVVDKIFTRIGAHDDISKGQSTFMVEMNETADILNNLSDRSLVILDEIGRGTSTVDGLSLAWSIAEHLGRTPARVLFATHFHELTALAQEIPGIKNYHVAVKDWGGEVVFLHKIVPGSTDDSYGIYVAQLAGIPKAIIARAQEVLRELEAHEDMNAALTTAPATVPSSPQLELFHQHMALATETIRRELAGIDINTLTPLEALSVLHQMKTRIETETVTP